MEGDVKVTINYDKLEADAKWDGLKGYLTNTDIPVEEVLYSLSQSMARGESFQNSEIQD